MKKTGSAASLTYLLTLLALAACQPKKSISTGASGRKVISAIALPTSFSLTIKERMLAVGTDFSISDGDNSFGRIEQKLLSWGATFIFSDEQGMRYGSSKSEIFSWGANTTIFDANGQVLGTIKEDILKSFFKTSTEYTIRDSMGLAIAKSQKLELFSTEIVLRDPSDKRIAQLNRGYFNVLGDRWQLSVYDSAKIDLRFMLSITAHKTYVDNQRKDSDPE